MEEKTVTISLDEYQSLLEDRSWLMCLESAGLDNWSGIDYAHELMQEAEE